MELEEKRLMEAQPRKRRNVWPLALIAILFLLLLGFIFYRLETWPTRSMRDSVAGLEQIGRDARDTFIKLAHLQPRVVINNRVYLEQTANIAELAVVSRQVEVEHEMLHSWAGSTKRIKLHGTFLAKAGFDLRKNFVVRLSPNEIVIQLPHPQVLSLEQKQVEILTLENGFWNRISPNDIEQELKILPQLAREKSKGLPAEAKAAFTKELRDHFHPPQPVRIVFPAVPPKD